MTLARLRAAGWMVGNHHDEEGLDMTRRTSWLLTRSGVCVCGTGQTDELALAQCDNRIRKLQLPRGYCNRCNREPVDASYTICLGCARDMEP